MKCFSKIDIFRRGRDFVVDYSKEIGMRQAIGRKEGAMGGNAG